MTGLMELTLEPGAIVRGDAHLKRVRHSAMTAKIENVGEIGLLLNLTGVHRVEGRVDGRFWSSHPRPGSTSVLPPACCCDLQFSGSCSVLMLKIGWAKIADGAARAEIDGARISISPRINIDDPMLARLMLAAAAAQKSDEYDKVLQNLVDYVVMLARAAPYRRSLGLSGATLRRVLELCGNPAGNPPSLERLAREAELSPYHFSRCFKQATGYSPHRYLVRRKVERALDLLARTSMSVSDIAREVGFTHASHQARHIRREMGLSRRRFREHVLP